MKHVCIIIASGFLIGFISCSKKDTKPDNFIGKWSLSEIYGNDYYGRPAYWKPANKSTRLQFTTDNKYYRKDPSDADLVLIGTYTLMDDNKIQVTPIDTGSSAYYLSYSFQEGGYMTWGNFNTEDRVNEKFKLE